MPGLPGVPVVPVCEHYVGTVVRLLGVFSSYISRRAQALSLVVVSKRIVTEGRAPSSHWWHLDNPP